MAARAPLSRARHREAALKHYVAAIDQGTTSTRCLVLDSSGSVVSADQLEHRQVLPRPGWVEHDPAEIWHNTCTVVAGALDRGGVDPAHVAAVGIANQRETTVVWDRHTGKPVCNAIVWQDLRTQSLCDELAAGAQAVDRYRATTGLPLATYFSGPKVAWILQHVAGARARAEAGDLLFGTLDTWLLWNLTGGPQGGLHRTDVTNASRTLLMDLETLAWDPGIASDMGIPLTMLPEITSSSQVYGACRGGALDGTAIAGMLGDQQAATFGQACFDVGTAKNTYGTGNFMLLNTGERRVTSRHGLLTTVCYQLGDEPPVYALEGSIAVTGSLVQWMRDSLGLVADADGIESLAATVDDNGGAYLVPAFSGLFAPYWRPDARGALVGLTRYVNRGHLARAALEATAFQSREVLDAMNADSGEPLQELRVDGGMVGNELLMQFQADLLDVDVVRPQVTETTAVGAAYAAGLAVGFWTDLEQLRGNWREDKRWTPRLPREERDRLYRNWKKAVTKTLDWVDDDVI